MKVREKSRALSALECICHAAFAYPVITLIWYMFAKQDCANIPVFLMISASEVFLYILRRRLHKVWMLAGILMAYILLFLAAVNYLGGIYLFSSVMMSIFCMITVWAGSVADFEVPSPGIGVLLFLIGICVWLASSAKFTVIFYAFEAVYVFALVIYGNLKSADDFIWENRRTAFLSVGQIKNTNYLITLILALIILAATTISAILFSPILNCLKQPLLGLIYKFMGGIPELPQMYEMSGQGGEEELAEGPPELGGGSSVVSMLAAIFAFIITAIIIILLIIFIVDIIKRLGAGTIDGDIKEYIIPFKKADVSSVEKEEEDKIDDKPAKKIRKIYKKKIKSKLKKAGAALRASTPDEQKNLAGLNGEGIEEFMALYHKARYSNEECTEDDVEHMNNISRTEC